MWYRKSSPHKGLYFNVDGKAIWGFDPVAYFTLSKTAKGKNSISAEYEGVNWFFANEKHKELFLKNPTDYVPQFGGYCAHGMAHGYAASTNPYRWTIVDGKLYLNYSRSYQSRWREKKEEFIKKAIKSWPILKRMLV